MIKKTENSNLLKNTMPRKGLNSTKNPSVIELPFQNDTDRDTKKRISLMFALEML
jgi:hypothetical protein